MKKYYLAIESPQTINEFGFTYKYNLHEIDEITFFNLGLWLFKIIRTEENDLIAY